MCVNYLLVPQDIAMSVVKTTIGFENVIFVGGIADYMNLKPLITLPISDIDLVYSNKDNLINMFEHYDVKKSTHSEVVYNEHIEEYFYLDLDLKVTSIRIDLFKDKVDIEYDEGYFYGYKIKYASFDRMRDFHNNIIEYLLNSDNSSNDTERIIKHSKKATYYNILNKTK